jgi:pimeloyl-ACP methyl ester carboxylesterase
LLQRENESRQSAFPVWTRPEDVPARVHSADLENQLLFNRPQGHQQVLSTPHGELFWVEAGSGRPVLFVHGLGHDAWDWRPLFERRPQGLKYAALDLPGFGLSELDPRPGIVERMRDAVLHAATILEEKPIVVGSSLGGHLALLAALKAPDAFAGLLLVSPGGLYLPPTPMRRMAQELYRFENLVGRSDADVVAGARRIFSTPHKKREELAARKLAIHRSEKKRAYMAPFAQLVAEVFDHNVGEDLGRLDQPVEMVFGDRDAIVPHPLVKKVATRWRIPFHLLHEVGHLPMVEAPQRFGQIAHAFFNRVFQSEAS